MAGFGQIAHMTRDADCSVLDVGFCDKPEAPGFVGVCCDISIDPDCTMADPGCVGKGGGSKQLPIGACSSSSGYRSNSTLEAFWQLLTGQVCEPQAPFACEPIVLSGDDSPSEAAARALFYALRVNSRSFRQLFDNVAAYYSCEYGAAAYEGVRAVLCNHKIMDCDAPAPIECGECGDAVLDAGEACDLTAVPVTCEDLGYDGGEVSCSLTCEIVDDECFHAAPTTGGTGGQNAGETGGLATGADSATTGGVSDPGGCGCRQRGGSAPGTSLLLGLGFLAGAARRRRNT